MGKLFAKLSVKIFNLIYKVQQNKHKKKMMNLKKVMSANCNGNKVAISSGATVSINSKTNERKVDTKKVESIIKTFLSDKDGLNKLFKYIEGAGTKVYKTRFANKILDVINEQEGFILPQKGLKALWLNLILNKKIGLKTKEMFVLRNLKVNIYAMCYQFYNWYSYKMNLTGYDTKTQTQFKNVFRICTSKKIEELSYEEIIGLKTAIKRDIEAIDFVMELSRKNDMSKKNLDKIKNKQAVRI